MADNGLYDRDPRDVGTASAGPNGQGNHKTAALQAVSRLYFVSEYVSLAAHNCISQSQSHRMEGQL